VRRTNPTEVPPPGLATEERQSQPMDEHDADIGRSPLTWGRGEPDVWRQARPVGGAGRRTRPAEGDTASRPDPCRTGSAGGRRPHITTAGVLLRSAGYLMPLSRLIQRAVPFPPLRKNVLAVAVKR
jgi:hypothetical protein